MNENRFFVIDSELLEDVRPALYGFKIECENVVTEIEQVNNYEPGGEGCYVLINKEGDKITISQDYDGSFGLYLYRQNDYYAISNSFLGLVEYLKPRKLSLDLDLIYAMIPSVMVANKSKNHTFVNEIKPIDKDIFVSIDITSREISFINHYSNETQNMSIADKIDMLDLWHDKWVSVIRKAYAKNIPIVCELSGGMDSRLVLSLFLDANVELKNIIFLSSNDGLHTHTEDFEIASKIANKFGFMLNCGSSITEATSLKEVVENSLYTKAGVQKQLYMPLTKETIMKYTFCGGGGEKIRNYWYSSPDEFKNKLKWTAECFFRERNGLVEKSIDNIYDELFDDIAKKYNISNKADPSIPSTLWKDVVNGRHFGSSYIERMHNNIIKLQPLADRILEKALIHDENNIDDNFMVALILDRYVPELLNFNFDSGHMLSKNVLEMSKRINSAYPKQKKELAKLSRSLIDFSKPMKEYNIDYEPQRLMHMALLSAEVYHSVSEAVSEDYYYSVVEDVESRKYMPLIHALDALTIAYIVSDRKETMYDFLIRVTNPDEKPVIKNKLLRSLWKRTHKYYELIETNKKTKGDLVAF